MHTFQEMQHLGDSSTQLNQKDKGGEMEMIFVQLPGMPVISSVAEAQTCKRQITLYVQSTTGKAIAESDG